jgi:catechol 2,3-dioxygenase-like lactoylglutathione lyase family enzyme
VVTERVNELSIGMKGNEKKTVSTYGLTHVAMTVKDVEATLNFYRHIFGMEVMYHEEKMIQLTTPGNHDILVFEEKEEVRNLAGQSGGIAHIGFRLKQPGDADEIYKRIAEAGSEIIDKGEFVPGSPYIFFRDPDGYIIEVWYELLPE